MSLKSIALIPARSGSKRIKHKNIRLLGGHPLLAYTIWSATKSDIFDKIVCVTDDQKYADIAKQYGACVPLLRPKLISGDYSPDIEWVKWILRELSVQGQNFDIFSILRPTSPFRTKDTIIRGWNAFNEDPTADSLRAVQPCKQHPGKMWVLGERRMTPLMPLSNTDAPWHSSQKSSLPQFYAQDASLEIAWSRVAISGDTISGDSVLPFFSQGLEGFDINDPADWILAEHYIRTGVVSLPVIPRLG